MKAGRREDEGGAWEGAWSGCGGRVAKKRVRLLGATIVKCSAMLPEMSGLQFLVVQLLFAGPQSGAELRRAMKKAGVKIGPPSFSRLMRRMEETGYVYAQSEEGPSGCRLVCPRRFEVTDLGVGVWKQVREFYVAGNGPAAELVPIATEEGSLAHLPRKERLAILHRRTSRQIKRIFERCLGKKTI
jgi:DNA-binding PadR family transcriptional regulator